MTTKALTTTDNPPAQPGRPAPLSPLLARKLDLMVAGLEPAPVMRDADRRFGREEIPAALAPTDAQRRALEIRSGHLKTALSGAPAKAIAREVAGLRASFGPPVSPADAAIIVSGYVSSLEGMPLWAVKAACARALKGHVGARSLDFCPQPPQIRKACEDEILADSRERVRINRVLLADVRTPAPNPEVKTWFESLAKEFAARVVFEAPPPSPVEEALTEGDIPKAQAAGAKIMRGATLSPALRAKLGLGDEAPARRSLDT